MRKILTAVLVLAFTTFASAQLLMRTEKKEGQIFINLDTMPQIQYVLISNLYQNDHILKFDIGDKHKWYLVDKTMKPIKVDNSVEMYNLLHILNWIVVNVPEHANQTLFKRRETK